MLPTRRSIGTHVRSGGSVSLGTPPGHSRRVALSTLLRFATRVGLCGPRAALGLTRLG